MILVCNFDGIYNKYNLRGWGGPCLGGRGRVAGTSTGRPMLCPVQFHETPIIDNKVDGASGPRWSTVCLV